MEYNHAEQKKSEPPEVASGSGSGASGSDNGTRKPWGADEDRASVTTLPDLEGKQGKEHQRRHQHLHRVGKFNLRSAEDDLPTDWWFASTAIPLIAATFAPMANLLSIAALVVSWRNNIVDNVPEYYQSTSVGFPDPQWCIDLNIASLVCGFVGNLFLLFNFTKRVRYIVALPTTILLFYIASGILIGITVSMQIHCPPGKGQVYSQGYWNAVLAACLYLFNSMILMVNMWGYFLGHYPQHFTLTDEQRNLILQTMMFFVWLGGGAGVFSRIEGWTYPDAVYFCDVTILTVGFGDYYPTDDLSRGLVFPYSVGGTIILGLMVSSIHKFAGELSSVNVLRKHVERRRTNTLSRAVTVEDTQETRRDELEKEIEIGQLLRRKPVISSPLPNPIIQRNLDAAAHSTPCANPEPEESPQDLPPEPQVQFENTNAEFLKQSDEEEPHHSQFLNARDHSGPLHTTFKFLSGPVSTVRKARSRSQKAIVMREEKDRFDAMRAIQINARKFKKWYSLCVSVVAFGLLWCLGAVVFWQAEKHTQGLNYFEALYFCYVSLLTIGYGDMSPRSNAGKPFFVVWSLIAVPTMTVLISDMGDTVISSFKRGTFRLGDMTVLPKAGLWGDLLRSNPWLWKFISRRAEKKRLKAGFPVGPAEDEYPPNLSLQQLADDDVSEAEMTRRLAWAIRKTAGDLQHSRDKRYSYEEWCEFTRLIRFSKDGLAQLEYDEETDGVVEWDWLDDSSPMLSAQGEPEWVLDRLCESLLRLIKKNTPSGDSTPSSALPASSNADLSTFAFARKGTVAEDADGDGDGDRRSDKSAKGKEAQPRVPTEAEERQRRASGAEAVLTFFTGERKGAHAYAAEGPQWSKKARERLKQTRRHRPTTGAVGGGRGGAGLRTLKMRQFAGDGEQ
ncbi:hypothetical protein A1O3_06424 [Capronia epimyces CBS 606.96]|uniref:Potassium channel domain-containing protein n=1 Tax=Capronia epimyces CBS 606.96 TaxID=1182542 RepID=W9Y040_9EURO|nr:uncharacterized protein A1O3_06424 [Capronia epimyces CBS 606.96]EXJ82611.1 hypothetical protein A1O3_06424 [Capronia epimyces CBS 606.96]